MGFSESSIFAKVAFVLSIVGALILVIGLATTSWLTGDLIIKTKFKIRASVSFGLFSSCSTALGITQCASSTASTELSWLEATRAFVIIAFLVAIGLIVVLIVKIFVKSDMKILHLAAPILGLVAAVCVLIAVATFGAEGSEVFPTFHLGWSFGLTTGSAFLFIISGILLLLDKVRS